MEEAHRVMAEADKLMASRPSAASSFLSSFFASSPSPDYSDACDKYSTAGNLFKSCNEWAMAASAYLKAAAASERDKNSEEAARKRVAAAGCLRRVADGAEQAIGLYESAIEQYVRSGRFSMVGTYEKECGDICEKELGDKKRAADYYEKAARRSAAGCKVKEAALAAEAGLLERAVAIYEEQAKSDASDSTRRYNCKEHLFRAGLIRLAMADIVGAKKCIENSYCVIDSAFAISREHKLLTALVAATEDQDSDAFTAAVAEYERICRLDDWKVDILYRAKKVIEAAEPELL